MSLWPKPGRQLLPDGLELPISIAGRPLDPLGRKQRAAAALAEARLVRPDHLVITGDRGQFEVLVYWCDGVRVVPIAEERTVGAGVPAAA